MFIQKELQKIEQIGATAWSLVHEGNFRAATRQLNKIRNSMCVNESDQVVALVEAKILQLKGNIAGAKVRILRSLSYLWGSPEGFEIFAASNPKADANSSLYHIEMPGNAVRLGFFDCFDDSYIASLDAVANSEEEALNYVAEIAQCPHLSSIKSVSCSKHPLENGLYSFRGVIRTYPFHQVKKNGRVHK